MKPLTTEKRPLIATDADGRLYSVQFRQLVSSRVPAESLPALEAFGALTITSRLIHRVMDAWAEQHGLSGARISILFLLWHHAEGVPLGVMASRLNVSPRNVTGLIDNLERDGLVVRIPDPADRRTVLARLTEHGSQRIDAMWEETIRHQSELLEGFSEDELVQLRHLCLRVVTKLQTAVPHC